MRPVNSEDLYSMKWALDPQMSPDGERVLFGLKSIVHEGKLKGYKTQIYIACDGHVRQFTSGKNDTSPRWSPCGTKAAFLSDRGQDKNQIYIISFEGGEAARLTSLKGGAGEPVWSPDGKKIAFSALEGNRDACGDKDEEKSDVRVISKIRYKLNGRGFLPEENYQIFVADVDSGKMSQVTYGPYDCREPEWSPDGKMIAFISARFEDNDLSSVRDLWVVPAEGGEMKRLTSGDAVFYSPTWSPDGRYIACYGHDNEYKGATVPGICLIPSGGGPANYLTKASQIGVAQSVSSDVVSSPAARPAWSTDGKTIFFTALDNGRMALYSANTESGDIQKITGGDCAIYGWSKATHSCRFALAVTSPGLVCDIWSLDLASNGANQERAVLTVAGSTGRLFRLTNLNKEWLESVFLSIPEEVEVCSRDGQKLQAWIMKPVGMQDGKAYPLVLEIHGGPHTAFGFSFFHEFQLLASRGYGVIYGNPRGSTGYGQEFVAATHHDWGGKDYEDVMAFADYAARLPWVDEDRMGVTGGSYGGYMTNWVIGHTNRFKAAVTQRSTCNRFSQFGASDAAYMNGEFEFDGNPWDNPMAYLDRSPIMYVRNVETPLLLIHSEEDLRCPVSQAEEFFVALKKLKKEAVMVRFPGENHELSRSGKPKHRVERLEYIIAWFDRYTGPYTDDYSVSPAQPAQVSLRLPERLE
ncbi:MAG: prolyl oligopeptidase family serine peptidase [Bacillota bacterium]|jgi:dipeptidyl aminopeptidase/acylaminoacyl peptidase